MRTLLVSLAVVVVATMVWAIVGYFATLPLGVVYGWSGHPAIPAAPGAVYVLLYLVLLPAVSLYAAWRLLWRFARRDSTT